MDIVITGGFGFIGSHLVDHIVKLNPKSITVIDNGIAGTDDNYVPTNTNVPINILEKDIIDVIPKDFESPPSIIFHLAAQPDVKLSVNRPLFDFEQNVVRSIHLLEIARLMGVDHFIFTASGGTVYGEPIQTPTPESIALRPISNYGAAKAAIEMYLSSYSSLYNLKTTSLRFGNVYGPRSTHGVIHDFYNKLKLNPTQLEILGNGTQEKSYLFIDDCIDGIMTAAMRKSGGFEVYNMAYPSTNKVSEIADIMIDLHPSTKEVKKVFTGGDRGWNGDVRYIHLDISKIEELGWNPKINLKNGILRYMEWKNSTLK